MTMLNMHVKMMIWKPWSYFLPYHMLYASLSFNVFNCHFSLSYDFLFSFCTFYLLFQERDVSEESGWKLVHGDVFRPPRNLVILSAVVGTGAQLALLVLLVILLAIVGMLYVG